MKVYAYDPFIPNDEIWERGAMPLGAFTDIFQHQYISLHVRATKRTKKSINRSLLLRMPTGGTLINVTGKGLVHEGQLQEVLMERPDLHYLGGAASRNAE